MSWCDIDALLRHLGEEPSPDPKKRKAQHKLVYAMHADGMKAAHIGTTGRRLRFNTEWADEYLERKANTQRTFQQSAKKTHDDTVVTMPARNSHVA